MKLLRVAILGTSGAVGQEFLKVLAQRNFPVSELRLLGSKRSAGTVQEFLGKKITIQEATPDSFSGMDLVLSSAGSSVSKELAPHAVKAGAVVVDNTSAFRMDPNVPLVIPEINPEDVKKHKGMIANPNCSTIIMLVPLAPLQKKAGIKRIVAATYQAASGAGAAAMKELEDQARLVSAGGKPVPKVLPHQIAFNVFSHNSAIKEDGYCEEEIKMRKETKKIFHDESVEVVATTVRVPVLRAHSEALFVELRRSMTLDEVKKALQDAPGVKIVDDPDKNYFPMPIDASGKDDVLVGRIRVDPSAPNAFAMFVSGDQLRKGAALNAVQIAEILFKTKKAAP